MSSSNALTYSFTETCHWITGIATENGLKISGRKVKHIAGQWISQRDGEIDGVTGRTLLHSDPTGETAVKNVLAMIRRLQAHYENES